MQTQGIYKKTTSDHGVICLQKEQRLFLKCIVHYNCMDLIDLVKKLLVLTTHYSQQ